ncbi:hypothetical protein DVH29_00380 [Pelagibacterium lacus]|uniref:histidine kinase n=2 Tax=Pelagibacterium lacus TaxID=2282655 RepID=A0A369W9B5_9HYPH|nr:hypothetical protein DVH29_00380 [Pelagibacterium lacus]
MGSAEASGVGGTGFGGAAKPGGFANALTRPAVQIAAAAILLSTCLVAYDMARSVAETEERAQLIATLAAAQLAETAPRGVSGAPIAIPPALADGLHMVVSDAGGAVLFASASAETLRGNDYIDASVALDAGDVEVAVFLAAEPVWALLLHRLAAIAGILALVALGVWWAHRRGGGRAAMPSTPIEAVPYGLAHWQESGVLVCANAAFSRLLRLETAVMPGTPYSEVTRTIRGAITARPVLDASRQRMLEVTGEDGRTLMLDERPCPSGGFITIVTDITERKAADRLLGRIREEQKQLARRYHEEKLKAEASSRAKSSFLAHLSHEIRTPLNHIIGFTDMIRLETFGPLGDPKYRGYLEDIRRAGEQLLESFAEILDYAELEAGRKSLRSERVPLADLIEGCQARFATRARNAGVALQLGPIGDGELLADRHYLERMMANLLDNAIRFTERDGMVRLAAWVADGGVVLEVTDTGMGMSAELMEKLSQPFVLSDAAFTRGHHGIGLGIATARVIAEQSGGRLAIDSLPGIGTTVAVSLPLADTQAGHTRPHLSSARAA